MASHTLLTHAGGGQASQGGNFSPAPPPHRDLYARRQQIYPRLAHGWFRNLKWAVMLITLSLYYILPWLRWERGEGIPDQAVLADFQSEKFYFFFIELWPQDIHFLAGLLILAALALFLVTSLLGRVWCGYACPQTVWTDLYIWVERAFEGDRAARIRLDRAPWSFNKAWRKLGKHLVWLVIAFWTGGAFILYWHDAPGVAAGWFNGTAPLSAYWFAGILTLTTYFLAGWMREQVCTYMCPWPRIQAALTDEYALNITYRYDRGEPRAPLRKAQSRDKVGDCIDCDQCVQVCPVGIDIRNGAQLECIHCGLCIDACDQMMKRIGRPTGLIGYDTDLAVAARTLGQRVPKYRLIRPRTGLYALLILVIGALMSWGLATRQTLEVNILKDRSPAYVRLSSGLIQNGYTLKLVNKRAEARRLELSLTGAEGLTFSVIGLEQAGSAPVELPIGAHGVDRFRVLVQAPATLAQGQIAFTLHDIDSQETQISPVAFRVP